MKLLKLHKGMKRQNTEFKPNKPPGSIHLMPKIPTVDVRFPLFCHVIARRSSLVAIPVAKP